MRKHCALLCLICASVLAVGNSFIDAADPTTLPLLQLSDLVYTGGFRLPTDLYTGEGFSLGGLAVAYHPNRNSLFVSSRIGKIAEVSIPSPVVTANPAAMQFATYLQGFVDPTEGNLSQIATSGASIEGLLVSGDKIYGTGAIYYDAQNTQIVSHYSRSTNLSVSSFVGMSQVWETAKAGFVSGYMATVPSEWQALLGGPAVTGQCCIPVVWRTSWGPAAFAWNPSDIGRINPVPATPLLYYSSDHPTLGPWLGSNPSYGGNVQMGGMAIIAGTRTALFVGRNGSGAFCYGNGTAIPSQAGTMGPDGTVWCYDPSNSDKGQHAYPYRYQIWAYDLNDFARVKAGQMQPWEVQPYGVWPLTFPTAEPGVHVGGVGYDAARQVLYISQMLADQDGYAYRPVMHALRINAPTSTPPTGSGPTPPPPAPPPSPTATAVQLLADKGVPQSAGTPITFTAAPTGGIAPHQYKWWVYDGASWSATTGWSTSASYTWTPVAANPSFRVGVWVRSNGNAADALEATTWVDFPIGAGATAPPAPPPASSGTVIAVALSASRTAPQPAGTTMTWTAAASGSASSKLYKWWIYDGASWAASGGWTTANTFAWTPTAVNPNFRVGVWAKGASNPADALEASAESPFAISAAGTTPSGPPVTPPSSARVSSVLLSANKIAPQPRGTTTVFSALPAGGTAPYQFKWYVYNGLAWTSPTGWTTSSTYTWSPGDENPNYRIGVWARSAGNAADALEASVEMAFPTTGITYTAPPPPPPASTASSVSITPSSTTAGVGNTVVWTAAPTSGVAPHQYKWWVYDGASWTAVTGWTTSNIYSWVPSAINPNYRVGVWVRSAGATADALEASREYAYPISR